MVDDDDDDDAVAVNQRMRKINSCNIFTKISQLGKNIISKLIILSG